MTDLDGITVRRAIAIVLEGLAGDPLEWLARDRRPAMRAHVIRYVLDYAAARGVILVRRDVVDQLDEIEAELRAGLPLNGGKPRDKGENAC